MRERMYSRGLLVVIVSAASSAFGSQLPVSNPTFDATVADAGKSGLTPGDPIPAVSYTQGVGSGVPLGDASTGASIGGATADFLGYTTSAQGSTGTFNYANVFTGDEVKLGPAGYVSLGLGSADITLSQTLAGTPVQATSEYVLTVDVSARDDAGITFPTVILNFTSNGVVIPGSVQMFTAPAAGGTSTATLTLITGPVVSAGDIGFQLTGSGYVGGPASQAFFDNVAISQTLLPEPAMAGLFCLGSLAALRRRF